MNLEIGTMSTLVNALPSQFPFYHLGNVEMAPVSEAWAAELPDLSKIIDDSNAIAFMLQGEIKAILLVIFEKGLDVPTYTELGNILASQLATRLSNEANLDVLISPPVHLTQSHIEVLPRLGTLLTQRTYRHNDHNQIVEVKTLLLAATKANTGEKGNA